MPSIQLKDRKKPKKLKDRKFPYLVDVSVDSRHLVLKRHLKMSRVIRSTVAVPKLCISVKMLLEWPPRIPWKVAITITLAMRQRVAR